MKTREEIIAEIEKEYEALSVEEKNNVNAYIAKLKSSRQS